MVGTRFLALVVVSVVVVAACSPSALRADDVPPLPEIAPAQITTLLNDSTRPVVLNVWASWCRPCRSEAPLLRVAHREHGEQIRFVGIDVRDDQQGARAFIAEFGLDGFEHYFDPSGRAASELGGYGVPQTHFFAPGGELVRRHHGVIDERTLALQIDELTRLGG